jgi:hypothetical protein
MATHTTSGGNEYGRKFSISRENGQVDKNGKPYFFEWVKQLPSDPGKRKFETRKSGAGEDRHYELFSALDGFLISVEKSLQTFGGTKKEETWLKALLIDAGDEYHIEIGRLDGRYSMDFMKRLLDPVFDPNQKLRLSPVVSAPKDGNKGGMFLSTFSGVNKLEAGYQCAHLAGMPQGEKFNIRGEDVWDFSKVAEWLYEQVQARVIPRLMKDPISAPQHVTAAPASPQSAPPSNPFPTEVPPPTADDFSDLPF